MSLDVDVSPIWTAVNNFFPVFFPILAIGGGIGIALKLGTFLINKIQSAF